MTFFPNSIHDHNVWNALVTTCWLFWLHTINTEYKVELCRDGTDTTHLTIAEQPCSNIIRTRFSKIVILQPAATNKFIQSGYNTIHQLCVGSCYNNDWNLPTSTCFMESFLHSVTRWMTVVRHQSDLVLKQWDSIQYIMKYLHWSNRRPLQVHPQISVHRVYPEVYLNFYEATGQYTEYATSINWHKSTFSFLN